MNAIATAIAETRIDRIRDSAVNVTFSLQVEADAREDRDTHLDALVNSLIGQPNTMTGKVHSATSAKEAAKELDGYKAKEKAVLDAECRRILAWADYERAKLTAKLAVIAAGGAE